MRLSSVLAVALSVGYAAAASPRFSRVVHERRHDLPSGWRSVKRAPHGATLPVRIGLVQPNVDNIDAFLLDVSHPESPNYGKHWTAAKVADKFRPTAEAIDTILAWLSSSGVDTHEVVLSSGYAWMLVDLSVEDAERLLGTEYHVYQHEDGTEHIACEKEYYLPENVSKHVDIVMPTLHFDVRTTKNVKKSNLDGSSQRARGPSFEPSFPRVNSRSEPPSSQFDPDSLENCDRRITPPCIRALYDFDYNFTQSANNSIGVSEFSPQVYLPEDLDMFFESFSSGQVGSRPKLISIDGGQNNVTGVSYLGESDLDLQYAMSLMGEGQTVNLYQIGDGVKQPSFNNFLDALDGSYCTYDGGDNPAYDAVYPDNGYQGFESCGTAPLSHIISTSYTYDEYVFTPAYMQRQCKEYAKLGLMGTTLLFASGDFGVAGYDNQCLANGTVSPNGPTFVPTWPSTCPYVTSVGATQIPAGGNVQSEEVACQTLISSSGGFSNVFGLPAYQESAVKGFLGNFTPPYLSDVWNSTGLSRGFPDLSANGANYSVVDNGTWTALSGTSASTPVVAAMLAAVNDARSALGKGPIGFINPTIYSSLFAEAFHDITKGSNPGCGTPGFNAQPGWDPVTGLGTPNFTKLLELWKALP